MVDNIAVTPGSGATVATDDIGGIQYQRVKNTWGPDGTANDTDVATGKPMPIQIRSATGLIPIGEPTAAASVATDTTSAALIPLTKGVISILGEVQASPTTNTMLERLKVINTSITSATITTGSQASPSSSYLSSVVGGDVAHDGVDSGNPVLQGRRAIAHGSNPTAVAAADRTVLYANRAGVPFMIGGHPNVITRSHIIAASDGAQTNAALLTISTGSKIVITQISVAMDAANTVNVAVKIGFGTATIAAASLAGTSGIILEGQFAAGGGHQKGNGSGIIAVGADNEDLRITSDSPTSGNIRVTYSYYTIES